MTDNIRQTRDGRVLTITIDRPETKNALTHEMYAAMAEALEQAHEDDTIRAVVFTGAGDMYTSGNDLGDFARPMPKGKPPVIRFLEALRDCDTPLIAAVNGPAVGVGLTMLLHCDLSFASDTATFRAPFAHVGLVPEAGSSMLLPAAVGNAWANDILLAGRTLSADEALSAGLVSRVFGASELMQAAQAVATDIAAQAPGAMRASKQLIRAGREAVAAKMKEEGVVFARQLASDEFREAATAFMERRAPNFG